MNVNTKTRRNSFLSNNLKNTSESNIINQNQQRNPSNNKKNPTNNILPENLNNKNKSKAILNEILSPNFSSAEIKGLNKAPFSVEKDNRKVSNNFEVPALISIFNKLSFDNAISKKAVSSLLPQQQEKNGINSYSNNNNNLKSSVIEKNEKNSNAYFSNNSNNAINNNSSNINTNNLNNVNNINNNINNKNSQNFNNSNNYNNNNNSKPKINNCERVSLSSFYKNEPLLIITNKPNNQSNKNTSALNSKQLNEPAQANNLNNLNNLNRNLNLGLGFNTGGVAANNINNNFNLISNNNNNNLNSAEALGSPNIPLLRPHQINVNINNYNINNFNIQSAIPLKSTKKFFKFENVNSSSANSKNIKNLENEFSPKNLTNVNTNFLSLNGLNPLTHNGANSNNAQVINNQSISALINLENNREYLLAGGKRGIVNGNKNARFNLNKFFSDSQVQAKNNGADAFGSNFIYNENLENMDSVLKKEREKSLADNNNYNKINYDQKNAVKDKDDNANNFNNKNVINQQNIKLSKYAKKDEINKIKNKNNNDDDEINSNFNLMCKNENNGFANANVIKNILGKEIIFDPGHSAKNLESVILLYIK